MIPHEARLTIDGGNGKRLPVRCEGYVEDDAFHVEAVFVEQFAGVVVGFGPTVTSQYTDFDIIENLKPSVIEAMEDEATEQRGWEGGR